MINICASGMLQDLSEPVNRSRPVGPGDGSEFGREPIQRQFIQIALAEAAAGSVAGTSQVSNNFGERPEVARIDLREIFLSALRPHQSADARTAAQGGQCVGQCIGAREFAQAGGTRLGDWDAQCHPVLGKGDMNQIQPMSSDHLGADAIDLADAMRRIDHEIALAKWIGILGLCLRGGRAKCGIHHRYRDYSRSCQLVHLICWNTNMGTFWQDSSAKASAREATFGSSSLMARAAV